MNRRTFIKSIGFLAATPIVSRILKFLPEQEEVLCATKYPDSFSNLGHSAFNAETLAIAAEKTREVMAAQVYNNAFKKTYASFKYI